MADDIVTRLRHATDPDRRVRVDPWESICEAALAEIERLRAERNEWRYVAELFGEAFRVDEWGQYVPSDGSDVHKAVIAYEQAKQEARRD